MKTLLILGAMAVISSALSLSSSPPSNQKKVVLITGANKGIGKEIARKIGKQNDTVCILGCRDEKLGQAAVDELKNKDGCQDVVFVKIDLDDVSTMVPAREFIQENFGRCDVLVNNAAICFNDPTLYGKVPHTPFKEQADITVRTNFFGTLALTQTMLPLMKETQSKSTTTPRIINIASSAGRLSILPSQERQNAFSSKNLKTSELEGYMRDFVSAVKDGTHQEKGWPNTCYGASKVAIIAMTKILARDEPTIMVNSIDPGYCATDQNNHQGYIPAERGALTPFLLATLPDTQFYSGLHWFQEQETQW